VTCGVLWNSQNTNPKRKFLKLRYLLHPPPGRVGREQRTAGEGLPGSDEALPKTCEFVFDPPSGSVKELLAFRKSTIQTMDTNTRKWLIEGKDFGSRYVPAEPRRAPHGATGTRLGRRPGESLEFEDYRDYQPGDDLRKLDWNVFARSDTLVVRVFREEVVPHLDIVLDGSASMAVREVKQAATVAMTGLMAGAGVAGGFSTRCWRVGEECREVTGSSGDVSGWVLDGFDSTRDSGEVFVTDAPRLQPRGIRVLISDLFFAADPELVTAVLARGASSAAIVQVLDQEDTSPPRHGTDRLIDSETGEPLEIFIDDVARRRYIERLEEHIRQWRCACERRNVTLVTVDAEEVLAGNVDGLLVRGILRAP